MSEQSQVTTELEYLSVQQVAKLLNVSHDSVQRQFENRAGVLDLGSSETMNKRRRRQLRISRAALARFIGDKQVNAHKLIATKNR